jgi:hypothetical protein
MGQAWEIEGGMVAGGRIHRNGSRRKGTGATYTKRYLGTGECVLQSVCLLLLLLLHLQSEGTWAAGQLGVDCLQKAARRCNLT